MINYLFEFIKLYLIGVWLLLKQLFSKHNQFKGENIDLHGRVAIVTGGTGGIGFQVSRRLTSLGAHVIIGGQTTDKLNSAVKKINAEYPDGQVEGVLLDLASFGSVRKFVKSFLSRGLALNYLINNAGVMLCPLSRTEDGFERQFGVNYLGHFLLNDLLLPTLKSSGSSQLNSRIVNVSSEAHRGSHLMWNNLNAEMFYSPHAAYRQSKLAIIISSYRMNRTLTDDYVTVTCVHPGIVNSDLYRHLAQPLNSIFAILGKVFFKTCTQGADTVLHATLSTLLEARGGIYLDNCQEIRSSAASYVEEDENELWTKTMDMIAD